MRGQPIRYLPNHSKRVRRDGPNPSGRCGCGCGEKTPIAAQTDRSCGHVRGKHVRFLPQHHRNSAPVKYVIDDQGCWIWMLALDDQGYGKCWDPERRIMSQAHRVFFKRLRGSVPAGYHLHHRCGNRRCVNPDHLEAMEPADHQQLHRDLAHAV